MNWVGVTQAASAIALVVGVVFGIVQIRYFRAAREREALGRSTLWEWFQWLAERIEEHESSESPVPAHVAHRDWVPRR
jgi:multisubunit Na+/H+ antiporter MnhE subunit